MNELSQLIVLSLEPWDDVWRRNQLLIAALLDETPGLQVLFVEPPISALRNMHSARPPWPQRRTLEGRPGVTVLQTVHWIPDRLAPYVPRRSAHAVLRAARDLGFDNPVVWINNHSLADFARDTRWAIVYDITDDWLLTEASGPRRIRAERDDGLLMQRADAVVVCSPALAVSRGAIRKVSMIPNGVDVAHFRTPQPRPEDLGEHRVAVYVGTLHDERLDVPLCCDIADELADVQFAYVGPDALREPSRHELGQRPNVRLLGPRPYADIPAYLQHANAVFIPHLVTPFTESLDPIKAGECLAVGVPTVATPVAGFRDLGPPVRVAARAEFANALEAALADPRRTDPPSGLWTWAAAGRAFGAVLSSVAPAHPSPND